MPSKLRAISLKQPWAALLVAGVKSVEIRTWATRMRGRVLIHSAKQSDPRPEGWRLINTPELKALATLCGGLIGVAELTVCVRYRTKEAFAEAVEVHRNAPNWFQPGGLYGFVFQNPHPIVYHACPGRTLFFVVEGITLS